MFHFPGRVMTLDPTRTRNPFEPSGALTTVAPSPDPAPCRREYRRLDDASCGVRRVQVYAVNDGEAATTHRAGDLAPNGRVVLSLRRRPVRL